MTRDEALDLLPLLAGGELDEVTAAAAQRAAEEDPTLMAELELYRALDAALTTAYAPDGASPPATAHALALAEPQAPRLVVVRRRCPYCHDAIEAEALVVCAACATPHHAPCFEANEGCSLLGCGSRASIAASGPASVVCQGCARSTPQGAPFCAWCGAEVEVQAATPRHARPREEAPFDWRRYAAAAALLLASTFGVGGMFGAQQSKVLEATAEAASVQRLDRLVQASEQLVDDFTALQLQEGALFWRSFDQLRELRPKRPGPADAPLVRRLDRLESALREVGRRYEVTIRTPIAVVELGAARLKQAPLPFALVFRPRGGGSGPTLVASSTGAVRAIRGAFDLDPMTLELRPAAGAVVIDTNWRTVWTQR